MYAKILVAFDGSEYASWGGDIALGLASQLGSEIVASHIYDAGIHTTRFKEMEPVLPEKYQETAYLEKLRNAHDGLICEGFDVLSKGYIDPFIEKARKKSVPVLQVHREGRNYIELYGIAAGLGADLTVLGAHGLAKTDGVLGSTAGRLLRLSPGDVLLVRGLPDADRPIIAGFDGSLEAGEALRKACFWAKTLSKPLIVTAVYNPYLHLSVFKKMAQALSSDRQEKIGLQKQEELHDQIIDDGLGDLYKTFLDQAKEICRGLGVDAETRLLPGKVFQAVADCAREVDAGLVVMGRYGQHRCDLVPIGSNSELLARICPSNVLITAPRAPRRMDSPLSSGIEARSEGSAPGEYRGTAGAGPAGVPVSEGALVWDEDALAALERVPGFARPMARGAVERKVLEKGGTSVSLADFREVAKSFGMIT